MFTPCITGKPYSTVIINYLIHIMSLWLKLFQLSNEISQLVKYIITVFIKREYYFNTILSYTILNVSFQPQLSTTFAKRIVWLHIGNGV